MASDRVIVDAGGGLFKTTNTTLLSSGAGYFSAALGTTGAALGSLSCSEASTKEADATSEGIAITPDAHSRKRAREDDTNQDDGSESAVKSAPKEIFVDRDPDLFADVLSFMRSDRLPAKTRHDIDRLEDLKTEASFFGYDNLEAACEEALNELQAAVDEALQPEPWPTAECCTYKLRPGQVLRIDVPEDHVLFIASATLAGNVRAHRYRPSEIQQEKRRKRNEESGRENTYAMAGCYLEPGRQTDHGDFQLEANIGNGEWISIVHLAVDHIRTDMNMGMNIDLRQDIRQCLAPLNGSVDRRIQLFCSGSGEWHLSCWIGDPSAIPQLNNSEPRNHRRERPQSSSTTATRAASTTAAIAVAMTAGAGTMMTAMVAMVAARVASLRRRRRR